MSFWQKLFCLTAPLLCLNSVEANKKLVFVQAIWRHGDRAPLQHPYPNDPYNEGAWPRGWGQLTNLGIQQMHELGKYFRERYKNFVSPKYVTKEIYIQSTAVDRAIASAQAFASGFYPAHDIFQWQNGSSWQPIPIHAPKPTVPDLELISLSVKCNNYNKLILEERKREGAIYNKQFADLFHVLKDKTGFKEFSYNNISRVYKINMELIHNLTNLQPDWVFHRWPMYNNRSTLEIANELKQKRITTMFNSPQRAKMMGGFLLNSFVESALGVASGQEMLSNKMLLYSSHDVTISSLMYAMNVSNDLLVPYTATLIMEIYSENGEHVVEFLYRNESTHPPYQLALPGCGTRCTVQKFAEQYANMTLKSFCQRQQLCGGPMFQQTGMCENLSAVLYACENKSSVICSSSKSILSIFLVLVLIVTNFL